MPSVNIRTYVSKLQTDFAVEKERMARAIKQGMRDAKLPVRAALQAEMKAAFNVKQDRFLRTWRIGVRSAGNGTMIIENVMKGFTLHTQGGFIGPRSGRAVLIPINTAGGTRIGAKKFYKMIDWLMQEKLTVIKDSVLYVKPPMNESRRGGVGVGTRIQKKFRSRFSGPRKRPSGFDIKLNDHGLTPIALIRRGVNMRKRIDMAAIVSRRIVPLILKGIQLHASQR